MSQREVVDDVYLIEHEQAGDWERFTVRRRFDDHPVGSRATRDAALKYIETRHYDRRGARDRDRGRGHAEARSDTPRLRITFNPFEALYEQD